MQDRHRSRLYAVSICFILSACVQTHGPSISQTDLLHDEAFPDYQNYHVETPEDVFDLDDAAKRYVASKLRPITSPDRRLEALVFGVFDPDVLNLVYSSNANTTANQTFHNRAANCLSMSILTYALARQAGFAAKFQNVEVPEFWTRSQGYNLLNRHINIYAWPRPELGTARIDQGGYEVDFDPQSNRKHFKKTFISENEVLAMFYSNKAIDALLEKNYAKSYAYLRQAVPRQRRFGYAWVNLGFLYQQLGYLEWAGASYREALRIDADNLAAWENLAGVYESTGELQKAQSIKTRLARLRDDNPYYHYYRGEQAFRQKNWQKALASYRRALSLNRDIHDFYFGIAKTYYQLGDISRSQHFLTLARKHSDSEHARIGYQDKIDFLGQRHL